MSADENEAYTGKSTYLDEKSDLHCWSLRIVGLFALSCFSVYLQDGAGMICCYGSVAGTLKREQAATTMPDGHPLSEKGWTKAALKMARILQTTFAGGNFRKRYLTSETVA